jgi:glycosyltransferase involved in cell wall biosynthesis
MTVVTNTSTETASARPTPRPASPKPAVRVFVPLTTPFLYGMERSVIELFDVLRPEVEAYFLQSNRILQRRPPIIREMIRRGFSIQYLPDKTDWDRLAKPRSLKHLLRMTIACIRCNLAILKGVWGKEVLYVSGISTASSSLLAAVYCRLTGRRVIHHFHDLGTTNRLFPLWVRLATDFIHNTDFGFQTVSEKLPVIKSKHNSILPQVLQVDERLPNDPICGALVSQRNLMFVGQISRHKGVDLLIEAFKVVAARHPDLMLHLLGDGNADFRFELQSEINRAGLNERVKFWGFRDDAARFLRFAYIYVHTSPPSRVHESFGRSVLEAMAHGVPVVCFKSGALREIVLHEHTGLVCEEGALQLASALCRFAEDRCFRDHCGHEARRRFRAEYSAEVVRPRWDGVIELNRE